LVLAGAVLLAFAAVKPAPAQAGFYISFGHGPYYGGYGYYRPYYYRYRPYYGYRYYRPYYGGHHRYYGHRYPYRRFQTESDG